MEDSLKKRYSIKLFANIINAMVNIVLVGMVPKALGPIAYGQFIYIQNFFTQVIGFLDASSSMALFTKLSARNSRKELISFYALFILGVLFILLLMVIGLHVMKANAFFFPDIATHAIFLGALFGFLTWMSQIFIKVSDAYALTVSVEVIKIIHKIISLAVLYLLITYVTFDLSVYFYFHYFSLVIFLGIVGFLFVKKEIFTPMLFHIHFDIKGLLKEFFTFCSPLVIYTIVGVLVGFFDIWLLQKIAGSAQTGFYGLAYSIVALCFLFTSAMTPIVSREFSKAYDEKNLERVRTLYLKYVPMLYSIASFLGIFVCLHSEAILGIFTDNSFRDAKWVLVIMAFYPLHQTYGQLSGSIFYAMGETKRYKNIGVSFMLLGFFVTLILVYFFNLQAIGLAIKMVVLQLFTVNVQLYFNAKALGLSLKYFLWHQIYALFYFFSIGAISSWLADEVTRGYLWNLVISGLLYTLFVIIFLYFFPKIFALTHDEVKNNLQRLMRGLKT